MKKIENYDKFWNMKGKITEFSFFSEYEIIKETEKAVLAKVDHYVPKMGGIREIKKWIPKSYLYLYEFENGLKCYLINHDFMTYA